MDPRTNATHDLLGSSRSHVAASAPGICGCLTCNVTDGPKAHRNLDMPADHAIGLLFAVTRQIVAQDRPGLLYDLASAISRQQCNIEVVLIDTQAHKAIDVFYVTSEGAKLPEDKQERLGAALKAVCAPR